MCIITLNWQPAAKSPLIIASNRDEFYARPTLPLHHWSGQRILAGKDMKAGGTWLGVGANGTRGKSAVRLAALTNYRDVNRHRVDALSRGHITLDFLQGTMSAAAYLQTLSRSVDLYNPFNLILFDGHDLLGFESRHAQPFKLPPGITSVSNADFNTPWPKLVRLRTDFEKTLGRADGAQRTETELFKMLACQEVASDDELPQTGIALLRERALSAVFIHTPDYGTRASSVVRIDESEITFTQRSFDAAGYCGEVKERLAWSAL